MDPVGKHMHWIRVIMARNISIHHCGKEKHRQKSQCSGKTGFCFFFKKKIKNMCEVVSGAGTWFSGEISTHSLPSRHKYLFCARHLMKMHYEPHVSYLFIQIFFIQYTWILIFPQVFIIFNNRMIRSKLKYSI